MQEKEDKYEKKEIDDNDDGYDDGHNLKMKLNDNIDRNTR